MIDDVAKPLVAEAAAKRLAAEADKARCGALKSIIDECYIRAKQAGRSRDYILALNGIATFALAQMEAGQ